MGFWEEEMASSSPLIAFQREKIFTTLLYDLACNLYLCSHRIRRCTREDRLALRVSESP